MCVLVKCRESEVVLCYLQLGIFVGRMLCLFAAWGGCHRMRVELTQTIGVFHSGDLNYSIPVEFV